MINALIIGCGYVGKAVAKRWKTEGINLGVTTTSQEKMASLEKLADRIFFLEKRPDWDSLLQDCDLLLLSLAAKSRDLYRETYLDTATNLLPALNRHKPFLIYTSSTSVYSENRGDTVSEQSALKRESILCETEQTLLSSTTDVSILRLGEIYGPGRELTRHLNRDFFPGNGDSITNLSCIDDIVNAIDFVKEKRLKGVFNLCSDLHITRKELYTKLAKRHEMPLPKWDPSVESHHTSKKIVNSEKIINAGFCFQQPE